eukprot:500624_1
MQLKSKENITSLKSSNECDAYSEKDETIPINNTTTDREYSTDTQYSTNRQYSRLYTMLVDKVPNPKTIWHKHSSRANDKIISYMHRSLYIFEPTNSLRRLLLQITENELFDRFILLCIVINCVFLAMDDNPNPNSYKAKLLFYSELIFNILYTFEMIIKIIAWGLIFSGPRSYLKSSWNVLDIIVVIGGWLNMCFTNTGNINALRSLRILKPLKAISSVSGMKIQVKALLSSIPSLLNVLALMTFLLFVFGILGMQLLGGKLRYKCVSETDCGTIIIANNTETQIYGLCSQDNIGQQCNKGTICIDVGYNPNNGVTSFDNILVSWLTILQCISLEGWTDTMYMINETSGKWFDIYFILLILFGSLFLINLIVAVIFIRFKAFKELEEEKMKRQLDAP